MSAYYIRYKFTASRFPLFLVFFSQHQGDLPVATNSADQPTVGAGAILSVGTTPAGESDVDTPDLLCAHFQVFLQRLHLLRCTAPSGVERGKARRLKEKLSANNTAAQRHLRWYNTAI